MKFNFTVFFTYPKRIVVALVLLLFEINIKIIYSTYLFLVFAALLCLCGQMIIVGLCLLNQILLSWQDFIWVIFFRSVFCVFTRFVIFGRRLFVCSRGWLCATLFCKEFRIGAVVLEPFLSKRVDHDGAEGCRNTHSKYCTSEHGLAINLVLGQIALLSLGQGETTEGGLDSGFGDPCEGHECPLLVGELFFESDDKCGEPAS